MLNYKFKLPYKTKKGIIYEKENIHISGKISVTTIELKN